jgi:hypothetical protein
VKALAKDDPEAQVFWGLMDEALGEDGQQFVFHCLSIALSLGGTELWGQIGPALFQGNNVSSTRVDGASTADVRRYVWLEGNTAAEAVKLILVRALKSQLRDAISAIDLLKAVPDVENPLFESDAVETTKSPSESNKQAPEQWAKLNNEQGEPTHINLFMWMRVMLQQLQIEQIHRGAAVRLMFESSAVGALTVQVPTSASKNIDGNGGDVDDGSQVEYPQFQSICRTLFPSISTTETAALYALCFDEGKRKVTAEVFMKVADLKGLFSRFMRLVALPILDDHIKVISSHAGTLTVASGDMPLTGAPEKLLDSHVFDAELRVKLGAIVHRRMAGLMPVLKSLLVSAPERWRTMLKELMDDVALSLESSRGAARPRSTAGAGGTRSLPDATAESKVAGYHIDGLQPFIFYRRLLSLALTVRSLTDNPIVPTELFSNKPRSKSALRFDLQQVDQLLDSLEDGLELGARMGVTAEAKRRQRFEAARRSAIARKIQAVARKFGESDIVMLTTFMKLYSS